MHDVDAAIVKSQGQPYRQECGKLSRGGRGHPPAAGAGRGCLGEGGTEARVELRVAGHLQVSVGERDGQLRQRHGRHTVQVVGGGQDPPFQNHGLFVAD